MSAPIYSFVAYSGTGKTSLLEQLVPILKGKGLRVAVIKHDAHDFEVDKKGKDSWRMTRAGADVCVVCSPTHAAIMENRPRSVEELLGLITDVDIILTEGYKHGPWRKIGLHRSATGKPLPEIEGEYLAVVSDVKLPVDTLIFELNDIEGLAELIISDMEKNNEQ